MARFKKDEQKLGYRTSDFFKGKFVVAKISPRPPKTCLAATRRVRYTQHKG